MAMKQLLLYFIVNISNEIIHKYNYGHTIKVR